MTATPGSCSPRGGGSCVVCHPKRRGRAKPRGPSLFFGQVSPGPQRLLERPPGRAAPPATEGYIVIIRHGEKDVDLSSNSLNRIGWERSLWLVEWVCQGGALEGGRQCFMNDELVFFKKMTAAVFGV